MTISTPIDEIEAWSKKQSPWRQDCLRRLAVSTELEETDISELLAMIKHQVGFELDSPAKEPVVFEKAHFGGSKHKPIVLKGIGKVENVNRLASNASLEFCPKALTVVYGRNGSGKSGFVRILRTACRTRIEHSAKLEILRDVYGGSDGPQTAEIIIDEGSGDVAIAWQSGKSALPQLSQVTVFDTMSAQLYVDGGNQIRFLPFGLALPHRLNTVCLTLKERIEAERETAVGSKVELASISLPVQRETNSQLFDRNLTKDTSDTEIQNATNFSQEDQEKLNQLVKVLSSSAAASADLTALMTWINSIAAECEAALKSFDDVALASMTRLKERAKAARKAAELSASELFNDEPLEGIGSETWRALWHAARDYSVKEAYFGEEFPKVANGEKVAACVLCQQPLLEDGVNRMQRFQDYMDGTLDRTASAAEMAVSEAKTEIPELKLLRAAEFPGHLEQIRKREANLAAKIVAFKKAVQERRLSAQARLDGNDHAAEPEAVSPHAELQALARALELEKDKLESAHGEKEREELAAEKAELEDRKLISENRSTLFKRRDLLKLDAAYTAALAEVQTRGITQQANKLLDKHLTTAVVDRFEAERGKFDIKHLKVGLARKSGQTKAEYEVDTQTTLTNVTSKILSEGEQRALALAGFLTEVALTDGAGPIIVDDPVSSLDRDRSAKVADRLSEEALERQVVVFTHDMVFFNELCKAAEDRGIEPATVALFSDMDAAGKVDAAGMVWKGLNVKRRIGRIKNDFAPLPKLLATSPSEYEYRVKNLYGRLRDTYERVIEEVVFCDIVRRGSDAIQTQLLRYVTLPDDLAIRFHEGMTLANTHSHDNPAADTVPVRTPIEFQSDLDALELLVHDFREASKTAEAARPQMRPKK
ncbi:AAA family ATPase [Ruegeria sp. HKCCD6157]|uniref:AAA family ATPase n=1 Tax=Ruegeria sp. HKCCD6157 TaxID=2690707 RepID=UPI001491E17C|nr:AAA family ATPase [Ruegeria sp. HKCCD6157]NOE24829.1 AAA family ATPase [Ruegeria sp. HKCCD6157]